MNVNITGPKIFIYNEALGGPILTESIVNMWIVMAFIALLCFILTRDLQVHCTTKRQAAAEWLVLKVNSMVTENMGESFAFFAPFIAALMGLSAFSSLSSLLTLFSPTRDVSVLLGWALAVFAIITFYKFKAGGVLGYLKGYLEPIPVLLPFNIISEIATPISMAFRHFGNIASGYVISSLLYAALASLSSAVLGLIPGAVGNLLSTIPIFQVGIPAIFSIYFDLFSSCLQAFIFCMLTMMYVASAAEG